MRVTENIHELRTIRRAMPGVFGLIPTMGSLHDGHAAIIRRARLECDHVGVSIFVNPAQFGPEEDLAKYPRALENDLALLESLGVDAVLTPFPENVYPPGYQTWITVENVSKPLEGAARPGHFRGVATVVAKLINIFTPDRAYFGQKDAQQAAVIRRMAEDLNFDVDIVVLPIVREADGLAMSSRNAYLNADERKAAPALYRALSAAKARFETGEKNADMLKAAVIETLSAEPLADVRYVSVADPDTIEELHEIRGGALLSAAVIIGKTRLIDNILLEKR
ncbi:MAG: pantoate--beta-alanine ligase [Acidobacteriota bacterium]|jgi:pantoate--beta-alanine ligase|nr:pantoate--beta-alanine ligase [Acidobacteriota bacterium]